ncbi:MAG: STAS domain-containing protein [Treponema sp.]|nr:STAS domain-containing protein [Candidatus Treponema caballi]
MDTMRINEKRGANYMLLELSGIINSYTYGEFKTKSYSYIRENNLVLDLSEVTDIDSSGLGVIMGVFNDGEDTGFKLYLMRPSSAAYKALDSTGFTDTFNIIHSVTEVL